MLAALNHPNIAAIHELAQAGGKYFLVLELVPGETLADRLRRGALPVVEAIAVMRQIAAALEAAHEKGIIHRDVKPANVKVTPDGRVKLLDFGLAISGLACAAAADLTEAPTATALTGIGTVAGTLPYMSPEQARGTPLDKRSDIWAFGCVFYEALTGRRLMDAATTSDLIAAILRDQVKLDALPAGTPPRVRRVVERCLRQDPHCRLRDIGDARIELDEPEQAAAVAVAKSWKRTVAVALGGALLGLALAGTWWWQRKTQAPVQAHVLFQHITDMVGMEDSPAISPDGKSVAFVAQQGNRRHIWVRMLAGGAPLRITTDDSDHEQPRWAPDSSSLIYYSPPAAEGAAGAIWEVAALGGAPRRVIDAMTGADLSHDGRHVAAFRIRDGHTELTVAARDGSGTTWSQTLPARYLYAYPRWSPDDRRIAIQGTDSYAFASVLQVLPSSGGNLREVIHGSSFKGLCWLPDGSGLVYGSAADSTVLYPPVHNLRTVALDGRGDRQLTFGDDSYMEPDMQGAGRLVVSRVQVRSDIWRFETGGTPAANTSSGVRITHQTGLAQVPSLSPDGAEIVYLSDSGGHANLWVSKVDGSGARQITFERDPEVSIGVPIWAPRGNRIVFIRTPKGRTSEWLVNSDATGLRELVPQGAAATWSGDGQWVYYTVSNKDAFCIEKISVEGGTPLGVRCDVALVASVSNDNSAFYYTRPGPKGATGEWDLLKARPETGVLERLAHVAGQRVPLKYTMFGPVLSPDGKWLANPLIDGSTTNIWVVAADSGAMHPLTDFGQRPVMIARRVSWSPDGKHIYAAVAEMDADVVLMDGLLPSAVSPTKAP
jgi:Tol biopolymer transport system component